MEFAYQKTPVETYWTPFYDNKLKSLFFCVHGGHLGFMQIVGDAQSCQSGNQARFVVEHIFITS